MYAAGRNRAVKLLCRCYQPCGMLLPDAGAGRGSAPAVPKREQRVSAAVGNER